MKSSERRNEFRQDVKIDKHRLDDMAEGQAEAFFKWSKKAVRAKASAERARLVLDIVSAKLDAKIRAYPSNYGIDPKKVTEPAIKARLLAHPKYIQAHEELIKSRSRAAILERAAESMEQRKRMIELMVSLHARQYFAEPNVNQSYHEALRARQQIESDQITRRQIQNMGRRTRRK